MGASRQRIRAVITGELRSLARQKTPFVLRTVYAGLAAMIILQAGVVSQGRGSGEALPILAFEAFARVAIIQMLLAAVAGALLGIASAYSERHNQTLGLLVLSQLKAHEVILGKLLALLGLVASILIGALPVFAIIGWAGGLDYVWLAALGVLTVAIAAMGISTGLACGFRWRSGTGAALVAFGLLTIPFWGATLKGAGCVTIPFELLGTIAWAARAVADQGLKSTWSFGTGIVVALVWTAVMVFLGSREVPRAAAGSEGRGLRGVFEKLDKFFEAINVGGVSFGSGQARPPRGNPVAWLGRTSGGLGLPQYGFRLLTLALLLSCWSFVLILDGGHWAKTVGLVWAVVVTLIAIAAGSAAFGEEKARGSLRVLLVTPMSAATILHGKLYIILRVALMIGVPVVVLLTLWSSVDRWMLWQWQPNLVYFLIGPVCGYLLARHLSLVLSSSLRAGLAAAVLLAGWMILLHLGQQPFGDSIDAIATGVATGLGIAAALAIVGAWAHSRRRLGIALVAFLGAVATIAITISGVDGLPIKEWNPLWALAIAGLLDLYSIACFDRTLGRSP